MYTQYIGIDVEEIPKIFICLQAISKAKEKEREHLQTNFKKEDCNQLFLCCLSGFK